MTSLTPPSVAELLDRDRTRLGADLDALWFRPETLDMMRKDLRDKSNRAVKAGDLAGYDKSVRALRAIVFAWRVASRAQARAAGGTP
jgi:hypothetical protein